ncbi:LytR/AlgR family response regulator transcription factor [Aquimarina hainanensis]|uniref:LytR/AlgR family response regulator transcription factor n=1 Tax=Aquimarina hainanensis TaxID=1578017 RepID=A0ABW5N2U6_9FLAO|nr:LytTR family DNA-binding domain-containing protein [Aquimarina sp. TRL1]QKX05870.1 response regulator transcription factor [Aquimarina sp. TRL1]
MGLKAIIVDDESHSREVLSNILKNRFSDITIMASVDSVDDAVSAIAINNPDIVFLDIELQSGTGFDILIKINPIRFNIIFITAFKHYALKAIKFSSLDYLLKPIDVDELEIAIKKAKKEKSEELYKNKLETLIHNLKEQPKLQKLCLSTVDNFEFIDIENIIYCKANGSYTSFFLKNKTSVLVSKHLKEYENLLVNKSFMRVHNSYLINLNEVKKYVKSDGGYILMSNNDHINISKAKKDTFIHAMSYL